MGICGTQRSNQAGIPQAQQFVVTTAGTICGGPHQQPELTTTDGSSITSSEQYAACRINSTRRRATSSLIGARPGNNMRRAASTARAPEAKRVRAEFVEEQYAACRINSTSGQLLRRAASTARGAVAALLIVPSMMGTICGVPHQQHEPIIHRNNMRRAASTARVVEPCDKLRASHRVGTICGVPHQQHEMI